MTTEASTDAATAPFLVYVVVFHSVWVAGPPHPEARYGDNDLRLRRRDGDRVQSTSESLWAPIVTHSTNDFLSFVLFRL